MKRPNLVDNSRVAYLGGMSTVSLVLAQGFTTGGHAAGYTLSGIDYGANDSGHNLNHANARMELWKSDGTPKTPSTKFRNLTALRYATSTEWYLKPESATTLDADRRTSWSCTRPTPPISAYSDTLP